jgi:hypothetical protein
LHGEKFPNVEFKKKKGLEMDKETIEKSDAELMWIKILNETHNLSKAMDLMAKWSEENCPDRGFICTNNDYEQDLEDEELEAKTRAYGKIEEADKLHEERMLRKNSRRGKAPASCKSCRHYSECKIRKDLYDPDTSAED